MRNGISKHLTKAVLVFALVVFAAGSAFAAPEVTLKFAGQLPADHVASILMEEIGQEIAEKTNGRIEVKVYPANQLGDYELVFEELIRGTIDMACTSVPSQFDPRLELVYINGFLRGYDDARKVFSPEGWLFKKMADMEADLGVRLAGFFVEGMIGTGATKPVIEPLNPAVDKGVLIRVPNMDVYKLAAEAMGYRTVTIPWSDVYQSLQTGVVEGVNGFSVTAAYTMLRDVLKEWHMTNYSIEVLNFMIGNKTWEKLSPADQAIVQEAISKAAARSIDLAQENDEKSMAMMREMGIKVFTYTPEELAPIAKAAASTWPMLEDKMTKELMDEFRKELGPK